MRVGHLSHVSRGTGCTAILFDHGATAGVFEFGAATGTRQFSALTPEHVVPRIDAVTFAGGSAFGLEAGAGVMRYLREQGVGFATRAGRIPIVPTAVIFDRSAGDPLRHPEKADGYEAARLAATGPIGRGCVGAGTGALVGKLLGPRWATRGGLGTASAIAGDVCVGALSVVNAFGDVLNRSGDVIAGARDPKMPHAFYRTTARLLEQALPHPTGFGESTTLCLVATNVRLSKLEASFAARLVAQALSHCVSPVGTRYDGDLVIVASCGDVASDPHIVGLLGQQVLCASVWDAIDAATGDAEVPARCDLAGGPAADDQ